MEFSDLDNADFFRIGSKDCLGRDLFVSLPNGGISIGSQCSVNAINTNTGSYEFIELDACVTRLIITRTSEDRQVH